MNQKATLFLKENAEPRYWGEFAILLDEKEKDYEQAQKDGSEETFFSLLLKVAKTKTDAYLYVPSVSDVYRDEIFGDLSCSIDGSSKDPYIRGDEGKLEESSTAFAVAMSVATGQMRDYLTWYEDYRNGEAASSIGDRVGRKESSVRSGMNRAKTFVLRHLMERRANLVCPSSTLPLVLKPVFDAFQEEDFEAARSILEESRSSLDGVDPYFSNLEGMILIQEGSTEDAIKAFERGLLILGLIYWQSCVELA